jgi:hypothetical protein
LQFCRTDYLAMHLMRDPLKIFFSPLPSVSRSVAVLRRYSMRGKFFPSLTPSYVNHSTARLEFSPMDHSAIAVLVSRHQARPEPRKQTEVSPLGNTQASYVCCAQRKCINSVHVLYPLQPTIETAGHADRAEENVPIDDSWEMVKVERARATMATS